MFIFTVYFFCLITMEACYWEINNFDLIVIAGLVSFVLEW